MGWALAVRLTAAPTTVVAQVYPSAEVVPENLVDERLTRQTRDVQFRID